MPERQPSHLIDVILPAREIHLLAGPSGAGKTKWLLETLIGWSAGLPVLGYKSHPVPWVYVSADRSIEGVKRNVDAMGIDPKRLPFIAAWDRRMSLETIIREAREDGQQLLVIESFGSFVEMPAMNKQVKDFMCETSAHLRINDMTIIGVVEQPKMKPNDRYSNPRQRISGVASWGHYAETIMMVEPADPKNGGPERTLLILPRNGPEMKYNALIGPRFQVLGPAI